MYKNIYLRFFFLFLLFGLLISLFIFFINSEILKNSIKEIHKIEANNFYYINREFIVNNIQEAKTSIDLTLKNKSFKSFIEDPSKVEEIQLNLLHIIDINREILQIRFLDINANEKLRIDHKHGEQSQIIQPNKLQNKLDRYYFSKTKELTNQNEYFVSDLDLNYENKKIEIPYQPTIRIAKKVFSENKDFKGILIINLNMKRYIELLNKSSNFDLYLVDKNGNFIIHQDISKSWTHDLNTKYNLENEVKLKNINLSQSFTFLMDDVFNNQQGIKFILVPKNDFLANIIHESNYDLLLTLIPLMVIFGLILSVYPAKAREKLLEQAEENKRNFEIVNNYVPISITNEKGIIKSVNMAFEELTGYSSNELIGYTHGKLKSGNIDNDIYKNLWKTISRGHIWSGELENTKKNGQTYWVEMLIEPVINKTTNKREFISISHNITDKKLTESLAQTDHLTNIANRSRLDEELDQALYTVKRYDTDISLMLLDIDYFKQVNDKYGHNVGDSVLIEFAQILKNIIRKSDVLGRWGGEEFLIISPNTKELDMCTFAEKVRKAVSEFEFKHVSHKTVSIGFTQIKKDDKDAKIVIKRADEALYKAKAQGRDMVCNERFCNVDFEKQTSINFSI